MLSIVMLIVVILNVVAPYKVFALLGGVHILKLILLVIRRLGLIS